MVAAAATHWAAVLTGGGASWFTSGLTGTSNARPSGGRCGPIPGIGVFSAGNTGAEIDAFDGGLLLFVDDVPLPVSTRVSEDDGALRVGPVTLSGLEIALTYTALRSSPTLRTLVRIRNPTTAVVSTQVAFATNFGSDTGTVIRATSDGDSAITTADRWAITSDNRLPPTADPVSTHVVAGPGAPNVLPALGTQVFACFGSDTNGLLATYDLSVRPGETQALLLYNQVHTQVADATTDVAAFDATPILGDPLLEGFDFDISTLATVVNWRLCRGPTHREAICRATGLLNDTRTSRTAGPLWDKLLSRASTVGDELGGALSAGCAGKKGASKRALKTADASLKTFIKLLKSKNAKASIADAARTRLGAVAAEIRKTVRQLATKSPVCTNLPDPRVSIADPRSTHRE